MNKAIMIGAGQIGRGFIGMELEQAGYHVLFADVDMNVIDDIRSRGEYVVHTIGTECFDTRIRNISAISSLSPDFPACFADGSCTLVCTSVGQTALEKIAPAIAAGIVCRMNAGITQWLNIIAVENSIGGTDRLRSFIFAHLPPEGKEYAEEYIGFPNSAVDRIIPPAKGLPYPADAVVERFSEWDVEAGPIKGSLLPIAGLDIVDDLKAYLERKLFTLNGPNAVTACFGYLKGYSTVNESLEDPEIYALVWRMMEECGRMLSLRHGFGSEEMLSYRTALMQRFRNPYIIDSVTRVAREPIRKLAPEDRIIAPLKLALSYGIPVDAYCTGVAAVLLYDNSEDAQSVLLQRRIAEEGPREVLSGICGLDKGSKESECIISEYERLKRLYP